MCQLLETIKIENREIKNLFFHNERLNRSRKELFGINDYLNLEDIISIPDKINNGVYKLRITYSQKIETIEFIPYKIKEITKLKIVEDNNILYDYKYSDRSILNKLLLSAPEADDIIIIKKGFVTDTSYSNLIFFNGTKWVTPATYLLNGTKRLFLLQKGIISEEEIRVADIKKYSQLKIINAMIDFEESPVISAEDIIY